MTKFEYELLANIMNDGCVARDKDGKIYFFLCDKGFLEKDGEQWKHRACIELNKELFQFINFEDNEPWNKDELLNKYESELEQYE